MPYFLEADDLVKSDMDTKQTLEVLDGVLAATDSLTPGPVGVGPGGGALSPVCCFFPDFRIPFKYHRKYQLNYFKSYQFTFTLQSEFLSFLGIRRASCGYSD